mmetsp:Transcript_13146/g.19697  ORF Transcript_13146/g.19697 Transcript_13146/m.19697 type:complete len:140 (-) Transcript_13146:110-529(-)
MGLLKHVVLPFDALLNFAFFVKLLILQDYAEPRADWGCTDIPMNLMENHLWHTLGAVALCNCIYCIAAIYAGNSFSRMLVCALQAFFFTVDGWSYVNLGVGLPGILYFVVGFNVVGLVAHFQEPGLFTKDKNDGGKKKN